VEFFYSTRVGGPASRKLDALLNGPQFDLPLENITWRVFLNEKWHVAKTSGALQLHEEARVSSSVVSDVQSYLSNEMLLNREKTKAAEEMLSAGNQLLARLVRIAGVTRPAGESPAVQDAKAVAAAAQAFADRARTRLSDQAA